MPSESRIAAADEDRGELMLLYQVSVADISFFKQQQWLVTSYAVGVYIGLVTTFAQLLSKPVQDWKRWLIVLLALATSSAAGGVLRQSQRSIRARRERLDRIRRYFGTPFKEAWKVEKERDDILLLLGAVRPLISYRQTARDL